MQDLTPSTPSRRPRLRCAPARPRLKLGVRFDEQTKILRGNVSLRSCNGPPGVLAAVGLVLGASDPNRTASCDSYGKSDASHQVFRYRGDVRHSRWRCIFWS